MNELLFAALFFWACVTTYLLVWYVSERWSPLVGVGGLLLILALLQLVWD